MSRAPQTEAASAPAAQVASQADKGAAACMLAAQITADASALIDILSELIGTGNEAGSTLSAACSLVQRIGLVADAIAVSRMGGSFEVAGHQSPLHWLLSDTQAEALATLKGGPRS